MRGSRKCEVSLGKTVHVHTRSSSRSVLRFLSLAGQLQLTFAFGGTLHLRLSSFLKKKIYIYIYICISVFQIVELFSLVAVSCRIVCVCLLSSLMKPDGTSLVELGDTETDI